MALLTTYLRLFRTNPALARLLIGEFVSGIGDWLYMVAILVVVYASSESALLLGIIGAARILPYVVLSVPAGIVVDRFDRRMVLLVTDVARGVLMLVLAALVVLEAPVLAIVAVSILAASFATFFGPAIAALIPTLVDESDLGPANSAWATLDNVAFIVGPGVAGLLIATGGLSLAFLLNAASFAVVAVILWHLPVRARPGTVEEGGATTPQGAPAAPTAWRRLAGPLTGPLVLDTVTSFVGGGVGVLTVIIAVDVLAAGEAGTGYLNAAAGVGGVVAGIAAGALVARRLAVPLLLGGIVAAVGVAWLAFAGNLLLALVAMGLLAAGALLLDVVNLTLLQRIVPDELRGRAMGILQTSSGLFYAAGSLLMPLLAGVLGVAPVLIGAAIATLVGAALALLLSGRAAQPEALDAERAVLLRLPIFAGLPVPRLEAAARASEQLSIGAAEVVVRQGDAADRFYVIGEGRFAVTRQESPDGEPIKLRELGPRDVFGEIGLLERSPRTATVTALTDARLLALDGPTFLDLVSAGPGLSTRLLDLYRGALART